MYRRHEEQGRPDHVRLAELINLYDINRNLHKAVKLSRVRTIDVSGDQLKRAIDKSIWMSNRGLIEAFRLKSAREYVAGVRELYGFDDQADVKFLTWLCGESIAKMAVYDNSHCE
jgi:hypothetical protein